MGAHPISVKAWRSSSQTAIEGLVSLDLCDINIVSTCLVTWLDGRAHYLNRSPLFHRGSGDKARGYEEDQRKEFSEHRGSLTWEKGPRLGLCAGGLKGCERNES